MENQQQSRTLKRVIMLDLSLFVFDLLDPVKINQKKHTRNKILEVPSALVLMMRDSKSGSPILFLFIYAILKKIKEKYTGKDITEPHLLKLKNSTNNQVRELALNAEKRLFENFSPLIDQRPSNIKITKEAPPNYSEREFQYPIQRYDEIETLTSTAQENLQKIYTKELQIPRHNLFDLYFAQIQHAQEQDNPNNHAGNRTVALGEETFNIITRWGKGTYKLNENIAQEKDIVQKSRNFINEFNWKYAKDDLKFGFVYDLPVALILSGPAGVGSSLITLVGGTVIKEIQRSSLDDVSKAILIAIVVILVLASSGLLFKISGWDFINWDFLKQTKSTPAPLTLLTTPNASPTAQATYTFTPIPPTPIPITNTPIPPTLLPPSPTVVAIFNLNYCRYLTQPGDTAQSISNWFGIPEETYRLENYSDAGTERTAGQIVYISASCCNAQYSSWHTYEVKQGDRLYNIATISGISVNDLAYANHITNQEYIQTRQMLCVPPEYP